MGRVAHPIHETQGHPVDPGLGEVILQDHGLPRHAGRFLQKDNRVVGMVQHIDEADDVEALVGMRDRLPVKEVDGNVRGRTRHDVDAANRRVRGAGGDARGDLAVTRADIEDRAAGVDQCAQRIAQNRDAAVEDDAVVHLTKGCCNHLSHLSDQWRHRPRSAGPRLIVSVWRMNSTIF
jgi:hypothetical protein